MKRFLSIFLALAMIFGLAACSSPAVEPEETYTVPVQPPEAVPEPTAPETWLVGISLPTEELMSMNQSGSFMKEGLEAAGCKVDLQFARNDVPTQISQLETMLAQGCKVLVIDPIEVDSLGQVLEQARAAGAIVVSYDRLILNSDAVDYYVTYDNWTAGVNQGQFIADKLGLSEAGGKTFHIEFVAGDPNDPVARTCYDGAMSVLQPYLDAGVLSCVSGQTAFEEVAVDGQYTNAAQARFEQLLTASYSDGTPLDAVLSSYDSTSQGVICALESSYDNSVYPIITGMDCDIVSVQYMLNSIGAVISEDTADDWFCPPLTVIYDYLEELPPRRQSMSIFKDDRALAEAAVDLVRALMDGTYASISDTLTFDNGARSVPAWTCDAPVCTPYDIQTLLLDSGYFTH